jgi:hypothetical protein
MIELDESTLPRKPDLANFFVECDGCGYDLRFDYLDQSRSCPKCDKITSLSPAFQAFLRKEKADALQWVRVIREQMGMTETNA